MVTAAVLVAIVAFMELTDLGLREAGVAAGVADAISLLLVVLLATRLLREFPPDEPSLAWAQTEPTRAATIIGVLIAAGLTGYFFVTVEDAGEATGASLLACACAAACAWICRRGYATRGAG